MVLMRWILRNTKNWTKKLVEQEMAFDCARVGLRVEDRLRKSADVWDAMKLMPIEWNVERQRRFKRAQDLDFKNEWLANDAIKAQDPWKQELVPMIAEVRRRRLEKATYK